MTEFNGVNSCPDVLNLVIDSLSNLRMLGGSGSDDEIWLFANACTAPAKLPKTRDILDPTLKSAAVTLNRVKSVKDTLYDLARSCERKLAVLKSELGPSFLHHGLRSLPDEVLVQIFQLVVGGYDRHFELSPELVVSHVCKHFRSLALSVPSLWSRVSSEMTESCLTRHLERSNVSPLTIIVSKGVASDKLKQFIQHVAPYASRWRSFQYLVHLANFSDPSFEVADYFGRLHLPNLESFELTSDDPSCIYDLEYLDFYATWSMPRVCNISISRIPPHAALSAFPLDRIRSFSFSCLEANDLNELLELLTSMPNLIELYLNIDEPQFIDSGCEMTDRDALTRLTTLSLHTRCSITFFAIMNYLSMPSLTKLDIAIDAFNSSYPPGNWLGHIPPKTYGSVKDLNFSFWMSENGMLDFNELIEKFPGLERLNLNGVYDSWYISDTNVELPPLRSVSMRPGTSTDFIDFLKAFTKMLKDSGRWDDFESFVFKGDEVLTRSRAEEILTKDKVKWYE